MSQKTVNAFVELIMGFNRAQRREMSFLLGKQEGIRQGKLQKKKVIEQGFEVRESRHSCKRKLHRAEA